MARSAVREYLSDCLHRWSARLSPHRSGRQEEVRLWRRSSHSFAAIPSLASISAANRRCSAYRSRRPKERVFGSRRSMSMKARGVQDVLILCGDGLTGWANAVEFAFPKTDVQLCVVHPIRNVTQFVSWKDRKPFVRRQAPDLPSTYRGVCRPRHGSLQTRLGRSLPDVRGFLAQTLEQPHHIFQISSGAAQDHLHHQCD